MPIEDVFTITGRGTVVTGRIEQGKIEVGNEVEIVGIHEKVEKTTVTGLEMFPKILDFAQAGDNAGALLATSSARTSSAARCSRSRAPSRRTRSSRPGVRPLEGGGRSPRRSSTAIGPRFYFARPT